MERFALPFSFLNSSLDPRVLSSKLFGQPQGHTLAAHLPNNAYTHHKRSQATDACSASNLLR
jgi:hypothetical protein